MTGGGSQRCLVVAAVPAPCNSRPATYACFKRRRNICRNRLVFPCSMDPHVGAPTEDRQRWIGLSPTRPRRARSRPLQCTSCSSSSWTRATRPLLAANDTRGDGRLFRADTRQLSDAFSAYEPLGVSEPVLRQLRILSRCGCAAFRLSCPCHRALASDDQVGHESPATGARCGEYRRKPGRCCIL